MNKRNIKNLNITYKGDKYEIQVYKTKRILGFKDIHNGASIFIVKGNPKGKNKGELSFMVNDKYMQELWRKYPASKEFNAYALAPEQSKIFLKWLKG